MPLTAQQHFFQSHKYKLKLTKKIQQNTKYDMQIKYATINASNN